MISDKQKHVIEQIEGNLNVSFNGTTRHEASQFISKYLTMSIDEAAQQSMEDECNSFGLPDQYGN